MRKLHWVSLALIAAPLVLMHACGDDDAPANPTGGGGSGGSGGSATGGKGGAGTSTEGGAGASIDAGDAKLDVPAVLDAPSEGGNQMCPDETGAGAGKT